MLIVSYVVVTERDESEIRRGPAGLTAYKNVTVFPFEVMKGDVDAGSCILHEDDFVVFSPYKICQTVSNGVEAAL